MAQGVAQAPPPPRPVFGVKVETVYVDAFVTRGGQPLPGLLASAFELKDNGVVQSLEVVATESLPLLAVLAFDTSSSVAGEKLAALRSAGEAFLDGLRPADEAALLGFCEEIEWFAKPTQDKAEVRRALQSLRAEGATAVFDALYASLRLPRSEARHLVVLFSDGEDNLSWLGERQVRAAAERSNALIHVVGLRQPQGPRSWNLTRPPESQEPEHIRALRQIAETTGGRFWEAESPDRLRSAFAAIAEAMNHRYVLRYQPQRVQSQGWHRIELSLRGHTGNVQARRGYWVAGR